MITPVSSHLLKNTAVPTFSTLRLSKDYAKLVRKVFLNFFALSDLIEYTGPQHIYSSCSNVLLFKKAKNVSTHFNMSALLS